MCLSIINVGYLTSNNVLTNIFIFHPYILPNSLLKEDHNKQKFICYVPSGVAVSAAKLEHETFLYLLSLGSLAASEDFTFSKVVAYTVTSTLAASSIASLVVTTSVPLEVVTSVTFVVATSPNATTSGLSIPGTSVTLGNSSAATIPVTSLAASDSVASLAASQ
ncbi:hypothetical protein VNO78_32801 [Psophocarpus tetragonolobus]|uniref:Uncharacterized protein n=1 Tax=Psophocarpus tetragonolobus TaxID=3891 RepID=A0AAN9P100_PSOTE